MRSKEIGLFVSMAIVAACSQQPTNQGSLEQSQRILNSQSISLHNYKVPDFGAKTIHLSFGTLNAVQIEKVITPHVGTNFGCNIYLGKGRGAVKETGSGTFNLQYKHDSGWDLAILSKSAFRYPNVPDHALILASQGGANARSGKLCLNDVLEELSESPELKKARFCEENVATYDVPQECADSETTAALKRKYIKGLSPELISDQRVQLFPVGLAEKHLSAIGVKLGIMDGQHFVFDKTSQKIELRCQGHVTQTLKVVGYDGLGDLRGYLMTSDGQFTDALIGDDYTANALELKGDHGVIEQLCTNSFDMEQERCEIKVDAETGCISEISLKD